MAVRNKEQMENIIYFDTQLYFKTRNIAMYV